MTPETHVECVLDGLSNLLAEPCLDQVEAVFAPDFCVVSKEEVFFLPSAKEQLLLVKGLKNTAQVFGVEQVSRRILEVRQEDPETLHSIHSSTWYADGKVLTAPFSTMLTFRRIAGAYRIARMQISSLAPCSLSSDLAHFKSTFAETDAINQVQLIVDKISQSVLAHDFDVFASCVRVPFYMQWDNQAQIVDTSDAMKERFRFIAHDIGMRSVTEIFRRVKSVQAARDDQLFATCTTYLLAETVLVAESVTNSMWFSKEADGEWVATGLLNPRLPPSVEISVE